MTSVKTPARVRFPRQTITGTVPDRIAPGSLSINFADRKMHTGDPGGQPVLISQLIRDWDFALAYRVNDLAIRGGVIIRALVDIPSSSGFDADEWESVSGTDRADFSEPYPAAVLTGGALTATDTNEVSVAAGAGVIPDISDPRTVLFSSVDWSSFSFALSLPITDAWLVVGLDVSGAVSCVALSDAGHAWRRAHLTLGYIQYDIAAGEIVDVFIARPKAANLATAYLDEYFANGGAYRARGMIVSPGVDLELDISAGTAVVLEYLDGVTAQNTVDIVAASPLSMTYCSVEGPTGAAVDALIATQWDNGGVLTPVPAGQYTIQFLFGGVDAGALFTLMEHGQATFANLNAALAALADQWETTTHYADSTITWPICAVIVREDSAAASEALIVMANNRGDPYTVAATGDVSQYFLVDGSRPLTGDMDAGGYAIDNADINGGDF